MNKGEFNCFMLKETSPGWAPPFCRFHLWSNLSCRLVCVTASALLSLSSVFTGKLFHSLSSLIDVRRPPRCLSLAVSLSLSLSYSAPSLSLAVSLVLSLSPPPLQNLQRIRRQEVSPPLFTLTMVVHVFLLSQKGTVRWMYLRGILHLTNIW